MSLQHELDALRAEFVRTAPPGRAALYDAKVKELQRTFAVEKSLKTGDFAPDFNLPNQSRRFISLAVVAQRSGGGDVLSWRLVSLLQTFSFAPISERSARSSCSAARSSRFRHSSLTGHCRRRR
jgi:hypothetical protein